MTNESNENLLKILLNQPEEQPAEDRGTFIDLGTAYVTAPSVAVEHVTYMNYNIFIAGSGKMVVYDENDKIVIPETNPTYAGKTYEIQALYIDSDGYLYGLGYPQNTGNLALLYFGYITVPDGDGNYTLRVNKVYNINTAISQIQNTTHFNSFMGLKLIKSPIDSRFLIAISGEIYGSNPNNLLYVVYQVNFEGEGTYEYRVGNITDYSYAFIQGTYASWTNDNVSVASIVRNVNNFGSSDKQASKYYKVTLDFTENSTITKTLITSVTSDISASGSNTNNGLMTSLNVGYIPIVEKDANNYVTVNIYKYDGELKLMYYLGASDTRSSSRAYVELAQLNNQVFGTTMISTSEGNWQCYAMHITSEGAEVFDYGTIGNDFLLIHNVYNYYKITFAYHSGIYIYRGNGYNGGPYFSDDSVTPAYTILYSNDTNTLLPIFSRDLYNITKVGNTLNSITQVPFNLLNDNNINEVKLLSKTAETITDTIQEINKNIYEELYINNINSFKVFDNNIGSTYNQECTLKVVDGILQGFNNNYKITKYRINYNDGTYENKPISYKEIDGNEGTIRMYIYLTKPGKNIELYDNSFTVPFLTIDISSFDIEKIYQVVQKIKVE